MKSGEARVERPDDASGNAGEKTSTCRGGGGAALWLAGRPPDTIWLVADHW